MFSRACANFISGTYTRSTVSLNNLVRITRVQECSGRRANQPKQLVESQGEMSTQMGMMNAHRSEADWLRLWKEILVLKCNQYNLRPSGPKGHLAERLVSFFAEFNRPMPSDNEEDEQHKKDSTELAEVERPQPPKISDLLASLTPGIERLIAQTLKSQESPARARRFSPEPGPSNDPKFTTHESSRSPGRHDTRGKRATHKRSRVNKARPQVRPPSKRRHSSSSDSGTYH